MSFLKRVNANLPVGSEHHGGLLSFAVDKGTRIGGAAGVAYLKGRSGDKFYLNVFGQSIGYDTLGGALGLLASGILSAMTNGRSTLAPHVERLADASLSVAAASWGAKKGMDHAGRQVAVLTPGKNVAALPGGGKKTLVGSIPHVTGAAHYLTPDEIVNYAARR